jgi:hypothetical protein
MTAIRQPESTSSSRRALLAGAVAGIGAWAASAIGRASPLRAADGEAVLVGGEYTATSRTMFTNTQDDGVALQGLAATDGIGVAGGSDSGAAVYGLSQSGWGVVGTSHANTGVSGFSFTSTSPAIAGHADGHSAGLAGFSGFNSPPATTKTGVFGHANQDGDANGVVGESQLGTGVRGVSEVSIGTLGLATASTGATFGAFGRSNSPAGIGVGGRGFANGTGVVGYSGGGAFPDAKTKTGVYGIAGQDSGSIGVRGSSPAGHGIHGDTGTGIGGYFSAPSTGTALYAAGKVRFSRSGKTYIAVGASSKAITLAGVTSSSLIFAVLASNRGGRWVRAVVVGSGSFTIYLNASLKSAAYLSWFVLN